MKFLKYIESYLLRRQVKIVVAKKVSSSELLKVSVDLDHVFHLHKEWPREIMSCTEEPHYEERLDKLKLLKLWKRREREDAVMNFKQ